MPVMKEVKKQIDSQTRESVGAVKVETQSSIFSEEGVPVWNIGRTGEPPMVVWSKTSYVFDRGDSFSLNPEAFNVPQAQASSQMVPTITGNFRETNTEALYNCRYSGWAGITGGGTVSLSIRTGNSNVSVWIDNVEILSETVGTFEPIDVEFSIGDLSLIQIFWYSPVADNSIAVIGDLSHQISVWTTSDLSPFFRTVEWYSDNPISSDWRMSTYTQQIGNYIELRWWFNIAEEVEEDDLDTDPNTGEPPVGTGSAVGDDASDLGGFGIWSIEFQEVGELDVISADTIAITGYYPSVSYLRVPTIVGSNGEEEGLVIEVDYIESYEPTSNTSILFATAHGLTDTDDGRTVEAGILRNIKDIAFSTLGGIYTDIFSTVDVNLVRGDRYYYLIDTFDSSPNRNRGGITEEYQTIIAGDFTPPDPVTGLTGTRNSVSSVTLDWNNSSFYSISGWNIYSDANSPDYIIIGGETDSCYFSSSLQVFETAMAENPGGFMVSIEFPNATPANQKYIRRVDSVAGATLTFNEALPENINNGDILRFLSVIEYVPNPIIGIAPSDPPDLVLLD